MTGIQRISGNYEFNLNLTRLKKEKFVLPKKIGNLAVNHFKDNFRKQGFVNESVEKWKKRAFNQDKGKGRRAILVKSGRLRKSIKVLKSRWDEIIVGTKGLKYAAIHNEGGKVRVTEKSKKFFWAKYKETKLEGWRNMALTDKKSFDVPQRKFIGKSKKLEQKILKTIVKSLNGVMK